MLESSLLRIDRDSTVIADMFMASGSYIEKGRLATIRIAHKSNLDQLSPLLCHGIHCPVDICLIRFQSRKGFTRRQDLLRLTLTDDLDLRSLLAP